MPTNTITPLPPAPTRANPDDFNTKADAFVSALGPFGTELNLLATELEGYTVDAETSATQAAASATSAIQATNVNEWVSGTTYTTGKCVYDTTDFLTYRRKTSGSGTTRPGLDSTNWQLITGQGDVTESEVPNIVKATMNSIGNAPMYACRAWVNFNATGVISIVGAGNVSSIIDIDVGNYAVKFATLMHDVNYSVCVTSNGGNGSSFARVFEGSTPTTELVRVENMFPNLGSYDASFMSVIVFR